MTWQDIAKKLGFKHRSDGPVDYDCYIAALNRMVIMAEEIERLRSMLDNLTMSAVIPHQCVFGTSGKCHLCDLRMIQ